MAPTVPPFAPLSFVAGDTVRFAVSAATLSTFPVAEGWTYSARLVGRAQLDGVVALVAGVQCVTFAAADTATLAPGAYRWTVRATNAAGEVYSADGATLTVTQDPASADETTGETHAARMLRAIDAVLEGRITADVESYQIGGRMVTRIPVPELVKLRGAYAARVGRERNGGRVFRPIEVAFVAP